MTKQLSEVSDYCVRLHSSLVNLILDLRCGDISKLDIIGAICDGIYFLLENLFTDKALVSAVHAIENQILICLSKKDYVLLADLLEYELEPILEGWCAV